MINPLIVLVAVAPVMAPDRAKVVTPDIADELILIPLMVEAVAAVMTPVFEIFQVLEVPEISLPVPELEMTRASPVAEESDWVKPRTDPVSVPVPEMLEVNWTKLAVSFKDPEEFVTTVLLARMSARASAAVRVPDRLN
jgi:hypothetical protein